MKKNTRTKRKNSANQSPQSIFDEHDLKVSKTELKKAMQRLQDLAIPLSRMSAKKIKNLPASEDFIETLLDLNDITSREARRRQLQLIGKRFRAETDEAVQGIVLALYEHTFSAEQRAKHDTWYTRIIEQGDEVIKTFCKRYKNAEPNTINQYLIHYEYAKDMADGMGQTLATNVLAMYIQQVLIIDNEK